MISKVLLAMVATGAVLPIAAQNVDNTKLLPPSTIFGTREQVQQIDISPDGNRIVYLSSGAGRISTAFVAELGSNGVPQAAITSNGKLGSLRWCKFVSNKRLICQVRGVTDINNVLVPYTRLLSLDTDGKNVTTLGQTASRYDERIRQFDGSVLDWLSGETDAILMMRDYVPEVQRLDSKINRPTDGKGVDKIDTRTMQVTKVESASKIVDYFLTDGLGNIRMKAYRPEHRGSEQLTERVNYHYRLKDSKEWILFSTWDERTGMFPIKVDADTNSAYILKKLEGRLALYRVSLDGQMKADLIYKHDKVDVDQVVRINRNSRAIGLTFAEDKRHVIYFDQKYAELTASLSKALPNLPMIDVIESSRDEKKLLIRAGSDSDPGRYYAYDVTSRALSELLLVRPELEGVHMASVQSISYPASDGTAIPAYLTLPPGKETSLGLPAVVMPHGGPTARDEWGFDWLAQFLAYQGFAVIQPNYRGSSGFGDTWLQQNGFKSWRTSIGDVTDAGKWLVTKGIADPNKLAIVGWSYGGYAALQSGVIAPNLFKALVAIAPVTDLDLIKYEARNYISSDLVEKEIGDGAHIIEGSPLQNTEKIKAPVLMFHGDMDLNVGVQHSKKMDAKLRSTGKTTELVLYKDLEHNLADSNARIHMLDKIDKFLKTSMGLK